MQVRIQVGLEHGVLFVLDPYADGVIPDDTGIAPVTFTDSCVAFHVASYVDGEADVIVSDTACVSEEPEFVGGIKAPNKLISLMDSRSFYFCIIPLREETADIILWRYEIDGLEKVWLQISNMDVY